MKVYENVLSEKLFAEVVKDLYSRLDKGIWSSSRFSWPEHIKKHISGSTNWTDIKKWYNEGIYKPYSEDEELLIKLIVNIKESVFPWQRLNRIIREHYPYKDEGEIAVMYYIMNPNAGISVHQDEDFYSWNATVYLNENWDADWGGLLLWNEDDTYFKGLVPKKNRMVVFDTNVSHIVTPVAHTAPQERATIQIRKVRKNNIMEKKNGKLS